MPARVSARPRKDKLFGRSPVIQHRKSHTYKVSKCISSSVVSHFHFRRSHTLHGSQAAFDQGPYQSQAAQDAPDSTAS